MKHEMIMRKSLFVNIGLVIIKIISGIFFNSIALIADGVHSLSDLLSDVFVILGIRHSVKPADEDHPFGHGKFEYVLSFILGLTINNDDNTVSVHQLDGAHTATIELDVSPASDLIFTGLQCSIESSMAVKGIIAYCTNCT